MKDNKICKKCAGRIDRKKERYVHLEDWHCMDMDNDSWWHLDCFKKSMNRDLTLLEKQAAMMLGKASKIFNNLPDEFKQEEYILQ